MTDLDLAKLKELATKFNANRQSSGVAAMYYEAILPPVVLALIARIEELETYQQAIARNIDHVLSGGKSVNRSDESDGS